MSLMHGHWNHQIKMSVAILLLAGGLAHLFPDTLIPILQGKTGPVTLQKILGLLSVVVSVWLVFSKNKPPHHTYGISEKV